jgi:lipoprotein-anchoring transpeptidase ErfK/SrfK
MKTDHAPSSRAASGRSRAARRAAGTVAALLGAALTLTACGGGDTGHAAAAAPASGGPMTAAAPAPARIRLAVADGKTDASIHTAADVLATGGRLTDVSVTASGGRRVAGTLSADGRSWRPESDLSPGTAYRLTARATSGGRVTSSAASFTTLATSHRLTGTYTPENGSTVGVGMPVSFTFDKPVSDRRAVTAGITVTSSSGQRVVGHWFGDQRVDFRPEQYWQAGSTVSVRIRLDGVKGAPGTYGYQDKTVRFTVGRSQVSTVDVRTHTMKVVRDGHLVRTLPITSGAPGKTTYNGRMVISEKLTQTRMDGATVGYAGQYDIPDVPHAMRLSDAGTFIHGNYWAADSVFGHQDVSHGCVGLDDVRGGGDPGQDASWFFHHSLIGDVVVVEHSHDRTISPDNGLNGWNMPWSAWTEASA